MRERPFVRPLGLMSSGLIVWAAHFALVYGLVSLACARDVLRDDLLGQPALVTVTLLVTAGAALVVAAAMAIATFRVDTEEPSGRFIRAMTIITGLLSLVAIAWNSLPVLLIPACA